MSNRWVTGVAAVALLSPLLAACGSPGAAQRLAVDSVRRPPAASISHPSTQKLERATASATVGAFRGIIDADTRALVAAAGRLQTAAVVQQTAAARADELTAQADFDQIRVLDSANTINAAAIDGLAPDLAQGQPFGGLHALERDLWSTPEPPAEVADLASGLVTQAQVAEFLLAKETLDPEAIGAVAAAELSWTNQMAVPGREELYSHLDAVDLVATVDAAHQAFSDIQPLGQMVAPSLTRMVATQFLPLLAAVAALGPPSGVTNATISPNERLVLSQRVDATATPLAQLAGTLVPFGTAGAPLMTGRLSRRQLLAGTGVAGAALVATGSTAAGATPSGPVEAAAVAFEGTHQAGVTTPPPAAMVFAAFDLTVGDATALGALLGQWTEAAGRLTLGQELVGPGGSYVPPPDTGEALGLPASALTITVGYGPTLFDHRFGLAGRRPAALVDLPSFAGDALDPALSGGDLCIQACANDPQVAFHAVHELSRLALGSATLRYMHNGFARTASSGSGQPTPRNLLGFHDGTDNLDPTDDTAMRRFVWADGTDQPWMTGGTYLVMRRIRIYLEAWDRTTLHDQQQTIGRVKVSGAPLGGSRQSDPLDLEAVGDYGQSVIPQNAHIRVAAPSSNNGQAILRRGDSFMDGVDPQSGELDAGLLFICFQKDPREQFIPIQTRLSLNDALGEYLLHTASGLFACPPGTTNGAAWGDGLV